MGKSFLKRSLGAFAAIACLFASSCSSGKKDDFELTVTLLDSDGIEVLSENTVKTQYGKNASFEFLLDEGCDISDISINGKSMIKQIDEIYKDGVLTVTDITRPSTVRITTGKKGKKVQYTIRQNPSYAGTEVEKSAKILAGSELTLLASPKTGAIFLGWTSDNPLEKGGKLISLEEQFTTVIDKNITIYANYDATDVDIPENRRTQPQPLVKPQRPEKYPSGGYNPAVVERKNLVNIIYNANGGYMADGNETFETDFCVDYHEMPNSLPENNVFARDGYVLAGYNTMPDGSGEYVGMGHKFHGKKGQTVTLYCMWERETSKENFSYTVSDDGKAVRIDKYLGSRSEVYIPKYIDSLPVTRISNDAFLNSSISYVYIPSTVKTVGENAFGNCANLSEITFFDSMSAMNDACFTGTPVRTVNLHAATNPKYPDNDLSFAKKYERFANHADKPRLIIVSGSSKHFGFDSEFAEEMLEGKYNVVNYGNNAQMNVVFFLEALSNLADKDDVILFAPEQYGPFCDTVNGNPEMTALTFQGCESCYNLISHVDVREYTRFFDCYTQYSAQRSGMNPKSYETRSFKIDEYGDCAIPRTNYNSESYRNGANGTFYFKADTIPADFAANVNRILSIAQKKGTKTFLSYPPYNKNACDPATLTEEGYDSYNADMKKVLSATLISDVRDYIMEGKFFYNTDYHLMEEGALFHTEQVILDFLAAIE